MNNMHYTFHNILQFLGCTVRESGSLKIQSLGRRDSLTSQYSLDKLCRERERERERGGERNSEICVKMLVRGIPS